MQNKFHFFWKSKLSQWGMDKFTNGIHTYNCCEQYMMAQKALLFGDEESFRKIMKADHPKDQQAIGRTVQDFNQEIWDKKARIIVYNGNFLRFSQNLESKKLLMDTEGELVEASPYDGVWGIKLAADNPDAQDKSKWQGKNWLREVLTRLREDFRTVQAGIIDIRKEWIDGKPANLLTDSARKR